MVHADLYQQYEPSRCSMAVLLRRVAKGLVKCTTTNDEEAGTAAAGADWRP